MKITFVTAGGTIDKDYASCANVYNFEIADPAVNRIMDWTNPNFDFEIMPILKKDSLDMNDKDRALILKICNNISNDKIVITHWTDTMIKTAKTLVDIKDKVIVLTWSAKPEKFIGSDAWFNVWVAVWAVSCLPIGVYVVMNWRVYSYDECIKNPETGQFIEKQSFHN